MVTIGSGKTWRSASTIVATEEIGYHVLKIDGYSRNKYLPFDECLKSRPFTVGSHRWRLCYYPSGQGNSYYKDYVCFDLLLDQDVATSVTAKHKIYLVDDAAAEQQALSSSLAASPVFQFSSHHRGPSVCVWRKDFEKSKHLSNDSFTVRCDIVVLNNCRMEEDTTFSSLVPACDLRQHLGDLLRTEKGADVVFEVAGKRIAAHRCVLAARSSVFCAELLGSMKEGINNAAGAVVHIEDMDADVFKELLFFAYTGSLPPATTQNVDDEDDFIKLQHLLVAADRYDMERLKLMCEEKLCQNMDVGTVATLLALSEQHSCDVMKKACLDFLGSQANMRAAMATEGFQHLRRSCPSLVEELIALMFKQM